MRVVGLRREAKVLAVAIEQGCHVVLDGPPGTGKSTLLRSIADGSGRSVQFVEGNAELTPARLLGSHDPALVLDGGYRDEAWVDGPLAISLRQGGLLYLEELNRIPEETLNVLITAMAEGEVFVPRLGRIEAADGFLLVAAMNPFDAVGTARVSQAIADRMCRIAIGYQDEEHERAIVTQVTGVNGRDVQVAVAVARGSRSHSAVRVGSSVRGAIDMVRLTRGVEPLDAALAAFSGRLQMHEDQDRSAEEVIEELLAAALRTVEDDDRSADESEPPGKATAPRTAGR